MIKAGDNEELTVDASRPCGAPAWSLEPGILGGFAASDRRPLIRPKTSPQPFPRSLASAFWPAPDHAARSARSTMEHVDAIILGAGAAGLMAAIPRFAHATFPRSS